MTGKQDAVWNDSRIERLKKLWPEGKSASEIAKVLGGGLTHSAVIGKVRRLGLKGRSKEAVAASNHTAVAKAPKVKAPPKPKPAPEPRPEPPAATTAPRLEANPKHLTLLDLPSSGCKWPYGSGPFTFCGDSRVGEGPYCRAHRQHARGVNTWGAPKRSSSGADLARLLRRYL